MRSEYISDSSEIDDVAAAVVNQADDLDLDTSVTYYLGEVSSAGCAKRICIQIAQLYRSVFLLEDAHGRMWMVFRCLRTRRLDIRAPYEFACPSELVASSIKFLTEGELNLSHACSLH